MPANGPSDNRHGRPLRRFEVNPGLLRLTGPRVKEDPNAGRCKQITYAGSRCLRDAVIEGYCRQHVKGRVDGF